MVLIVLLVVVLVGAGIAVWLLWPKGAIVPQSSPTPIPTPSPSATPPVTSPPSSVETTVSPSTAAGLLYAADFSKPEKEMALGWPNIAEGTDLRGFREGQYRIQRERSGGFLCGPDQEYGDCTLEVEAQPQEGGSSCYFGLYWHFQDLDNYYQLTVQNGYWHFGKYVDGKWTDLTGWMRNRQIPIGSSPSRILVFCQGSHYVFAINGSWVGESRDSSFTRGLVGVIGGASENQRILVAFDSLRLWENGQGPAMPTPYEQGSGLLYTADFSSPDQGWTEGNFDNVVFQRENGVYRIQVTKPQLIQYEPTGVLLRDFTVELEAEAAAGQSSLEYGLYFRQLDGENKYFFAVDNQGYFALQKRERGTWIPIIDWTDSLAMRMDGGVNRLRVTCQGNRIILMLNGHLLQEVQDDSFPAGDIAMAVGARDQAGAEVTFRSLRVWSVGEAPTMTVDPLQPRLIFSEDFAHPQSQWFEGHANDNPNYFLQLEEGGYFFTVGGQGTWIVYNMSGDFPADNTAELQASIQMGDPSDLFALLVRYQDENNYLGMMVNSSGTFAFVRCQNGELTSLSGPSTSAALNTGTGSNRLKVVCQGDHFQFYANDQLLGEVTDRTFLQGQITFAARRMGTQILRLRFESFKIWAMP